MAIKKYHKSKNLFTSDLTRYQFAIEPNHRRIVSFPGSYMYVIPTNGVEHFTLKIYNPGITVSVMRLALYDKPVPQEENIEHFIQAENTESPEITIDNVNNSPYLIVQIGSGYVNQHGFAGVMLNTGSTALPYEPYFTPYFSDEPYRKYGTETDIFTSLPTQIIGDGQSIMSCQISGNTVQDDTPTPEAPAEVVGCGEKTENLFEFGAFVSSITSIRGNGTFYGANGELSITSNELQDAYTIPFNGSSAGVYKIPVSPNTQYSVYAKSSNIQCAVFENGQTGTGQIHAWNGGSTTFTTLSSTTFVTIRFGIHPNLPLGTTGTVENIMLNIGSTAKPYEPYGYKLSIIVNGTEYPIYLGQVPTTRRIRKLVFDGTEDWEYRSGEPSSTFFIKFIGAHFINNSALCTHYPNQDSGGFNELADKHVLVRFASDGTRSYIGLRDTSFTKTHLEGTSELKEYLAAQYANGAPVTVWYVLATPEIAIVNEPLHKIGDYADTVAATNIPTTGTPENFDVGTTLKPSEVQLTYHGWHEHEDTKYTQGG